MIERPHVRSVLFGILSIAVIACGGSGGAGGTGGTSGGSGGTQGATGGSGAVSTGGNGTGSGGRSSSGGSAATGGSVGSGGGGTGGTGGAGGPGGSSTGGTGGGMAGAGPVGGRGGAPATGGRGGASGGQGGSAGRAGTGSGGAGTPGTCIASKSAGSNATGSGPHKVTVEVNSAPGIAEGTIYRPTDLGGGEKYPVLVWGEGACAKNGLANAAAMAEIASHGYFVVADGTPNGTGNRPQDRSMLNAMAAPLIAYVDWAIAENGKPCSAYYQSLDTTKIAANGFSCGGLMSQAMVLDPRVITFGVNSAGMKGANQDYFDLVKIPVLFVEGGPDDIAYEGATTGYAAISKLNVPVLFFSKNLGHGGDLLSARGGDFTKINIAWLNWWLKGDETATGKGLLVGASCPYCSNAAWEYKSMGIP